MMKARTIVPFAFLAGIVATVAVGSLFRKYPLQTDVAPYGIVDLELAGGVQRASEIVESWRAGGILADVGPSIRLDDRFFIPCYVATLVLGGVWASSAFSGRWARAVRWIAGAQIAAGLCDYAENRAMLGTVVALEAGGDPGAAPVVATACAVIKFILLAVGILAILAGAAARLRRGR
jgi:hypothetical protein